MFSHTLTTLFVLAVVLKSTSVTASLRSSLTTQKSVVTEPTARNTLQTNILCSVMVDKQTKLLFAKASDLYPDLEEFLSTVAAEGKEELVRTCINSRGNFMEYQNGEISRLRDVAVNQQIVVEKN